MKNIYATIPNEVVIKVTLLCGDSQIIVTISTPIIANVSISTE